MADIKQAGRRANIQPALSRANSERRALGPMGSTDRVTIVGCAWSMSANSTRNMTGSKG